MVRIWTGVCGGVNCDHYFARFNVPQVANSMHTLLSEVDTIT